MKYSLGTLTLLKRSLVVPILLFSSISLHCSFKKAFCSLEDTVNGKIQQKVITAMGEEALANVLGRDWVRCRSGGTTFDRLLRNGLSEECIFEQILFQQTKIRKNIYWMNTKAKLFFN